MSVRPPKTKHNFSVLHRYVVCKGYRDDQRLLSDYLIAANQELNDMKKTNEDITSLVPLDIIMQDKGFCDYMKKSNEE